MKKFLIFGIALVALMLASLPASAAVLGRAPGNAEPLDEFCRTYRGDVYTYADVTFVPDSLLVTSIVPTCNYRDRKGWIVAIVLHFTEGPAESAAHTFREFDGNSAHYILARDGRLIQMVPESKAAMHVRQTGPEFCKHPEVCAANGGDLASSTIGIEIENYGSLQELVSADGQPRYVNIFGYESTDLFIWTGSPLQHRYKYWDKYPDNQLAVLQMLIDDIRVRRPSVRFVVGHSDLQQKGDPGPALAEFLAEQPARAVDNYRRWYLP